jgi:hypothetical protein
MSDTFGGGSAGGYPGGSTPSGYTPHEDGSGRFMYDQQGELHMTPGYRDWLNANDQRIDWGGVTNDLMSILGSSYGTIAVGEVRTFIGFGIGALSEYFRRDRVPSGDDRRDDND